MVLINIESFSRASKICHNYVEQLEEYRGMVYKRITGNSINSDFLVFNHPSLMILDFRPQPMAHLRR